MPIVLLLQESFVSLGLEEWYKQVTSQKTDRTRCYWRSQGSSCHAVSSINLPSELQGSADACPLSSAQWTACSSTPVLARHVTGIRARGEARLVKNGFTKLYHTVRAVLTKILTCSIISAGLWYKFSKQVSKLCQLYILQSWTRIHDMWVPREYVTVMLYARLIEGQRSWFALFWTYLFLHVYSVGSLPVKDLKSKYHP